MIYLFYFIIVIVLYYNILFYFFYYYFLFYLLFFFILFSFFVFCIAWANDRIIRQWCVCVSGVYRDILRVADGGIAVSCLWNDSMERQTDSPALNLPSGSALRTRITYVSVRALWGGMRASLHPLTLYLTVIILSCQFFCMPWRWFVSFLKSALRRQAPGLVSVSQVWSFAVPPYLYPLNTHGCVAQRDWKRIAQ